MLNRLLMLLTLYLNRIYQLIDNYGDKYKRYGVQDYADAVIKGIKEMDACCNEIYAEVFVKIQSQKCRQFNANGHRKINEDINRIAGKVFTDIIESDIKAKK